MQLLIQRARIVDPGSLHHGKILDIYIEEGKIRRLGTEINAPGVQVFPHSGVCVSPGWIDIGAQVCDPGFEHREDLSSATASAAAGGYTAIAPFPNTLPPVSGKAEVAYLRSKTSGGLVDVHPVGTISENGAGKQIAELMDMAKAGAVAFSDGLHAVKHSGLMLRALQYVRSFNGLVINRPFDEELAFDGQVHEGLVGLGLGLRGIPNLSEDMMAQRDLSLNAYAASRLHIYGVSSGRTVELVRQAKAAGMEVTCSVPVLNIAFDDSALEGYDANFKVLPPLRGAEDRQALCAGLVDGTIDFVVSNHVPLEPEQKLLEFPYAEFGAIGLETTFGLMNKYLSGILDLDSMVRIFALRPREVLGLSMPGIQEGERANLTIFDPERRWKVSADAMHSRSRNTPLDGAELKGRVLGVVNNGAAWWI